MSSTACAGIGNRCAGFGAATAEAGFGAVKVRGGGGADGAAWVMATVDRWGVIDVGGCGGAHAVGGYGGGWGNRWGIVVGGEFTEGWWRMTRASIASLSGMGMVAGNGGRVGSVRDGFVYGFVVGVIRWHNAVRGEGALRSSSTEAALPTFSDTDRVTNGVPPKRPNWTRRGEVLLLWNGRKCGQISKSQGRMTEEGKCR